MRSKILIIIIVVIGINTYGQSQSERLNLAFKYRSKITLDRFFKYWHQEVKPISDEELIQMNDTLRNTYLVYTEFFLPLNLEKLGGSEWGNELYSKVKYIIVQNAIDIYFTEKIYFTDQQIIEYIYQEVDNKDWIQKALVVDGKLTEMAMDNFGSSSLSRQYESILKDSITDFRPIVKCDNKKALYLNNEYESILTNFLQNNYIQWGSEDIMSPARASGKSEKRKKFLEKRIKIWHGHWGGYWHIQSFPEAFSITFDSDMKYARISYRIVYQGGEAIFYNDNGVWTMISAKLTWIE